MAQGRQPGVAFAKTTRPVIGHAVRRESLFARLDGTAARTIAWIAGPAGSGKSTLAASYVEARNLPCLWYQLDPDDADVATFFHYLSHTARKLGNGRAQDLPLFAPEYAGDVASFSRKFFRQLFLHLKAPVALVLDNLHEVPAASPLHAAIEAGLAQVPSGHCVIILSRLEPPASLARMRVGGSLAYIGWDELRLSPEEIAEVANVRGQALSADALAKLHEFTQGWAAGLVLMLEHAKLSGRIAELPGDATPKVIFDYLAGEIFDRFEARTQQFLLKIACLSRMNAEIAQALSGEERAGRLLLNLAQNDYFVREVSGDKGRFFQIHPLLRDFLRNRAAQTLPEAVGAVDLRRVASLLRGAGHVEDAVSLLAEHGEWSEIARIASEEAEEMLADGRSETLCGWLELLPPQLLSSEARLLCVHAAGRVYSSPRSARHLFAQAYEKFQLTDDARGMMQSCSGAIRAIILEFDDLAALDQWSVPLEGLIAGRQEDGSRGAVELVASAMLIRALLLRDPGNDRLQQWLDRAERAARAVQDPQAASSALAELALGRAMSALFRGDVAAAGTITGSLQAHRNGRAPLTRTAIGIATAIGQLFDGSHTAAATTVHECLKEADADGIHGYNEWLRVIAAAAKLSAGDCDGARGELQALNAADHHLRRGDLALVHYLRAWLASLEDDAAGASRESKLALALATELGVPWLECLARASCAQVLSAEGDRRGAEAQLRTAEALAQRMRSPLLGSAVSLATACVALRARDESAALTPLQAGFALAREHGLRHIAAVRPQALAELCALALRKGIEPDYARTLARAANLTPPPSALRVKQWPRPFQVSLLGGFQLLRGSSPVEFSSKGPGRPMELLKVLVALGGQNVRSDQLADALWPRVDADYAHKSFTATLHRLRRILDEDEAVTLREGRLSLNSRLCWVDTWALDQVLADLDAALRDAPAGIPDPALRALSEEALALYRGPFLPDESEQPSYIAFREQVRARLLRCLSRVARRWEESGAADAAIDCYLRCIDADELGEAFYRNLMLCHERRGERTEALAAYERLRAVLSARLKSAPSAETQAIYSSLMRAAPPPAREPDQPLR